MDKDTRLFIKILVAVSVVLVIVTIGLFNLINTSSLNNFKFILLLVIWTALPVLAVGISAVISKQIKRK